MADASTTRGARAGRLRLAAVEAVLAVAVVVAAATTTPGTSATARSGPPHQGVALRKLAGQTVMSGFPGTTPPASLLARIRRGEVGGVILFGPNIASAAAAARLVRQLQAAASAGGNPPLLVAVDQEG